MVCTAIFPPEWAKLTQARAGEKYQPSNGTEGDMFFSRWCCHCMRDKAMREGCDIDECNDNECCDIITKTMAFTVEEPDYPSEWQYDKDGQPCCIAFVSEEMKITERDELTKDMFA